DQRQVRTVPLLVKKVENDFQFEGTGYWNLMPEELRNSFGHGYTFETAAPSSDRPEEFSLVMPVMPPRRYGYEKPFGRSGVLLFKGQPIFVNIGGKEYIVEVKGAGHADGGYDHYTQGTFPERKFMGGLEADAGRREYQNMVMTEGIAGLED